MGHAAVHDDDVLDALVDGLDAAVYLGDHAAVNHAVVDIHECVGGVDLGDEGAGIVLIAEQAHDVRHRD